MGSSGYERVRRSEVARGEKRETVRVWLLGGFRVSVGSRTIPQDAWRLSTTSLSTGDPTEKAFVERFPEGKNQYLGPILSLFDPNSRNIGRNSLLI